MMYTRRAFTPVVGNTVSTAVTGTSARVAITRSGMGTQSLRIVNAGTDTIFITFGGSTVVATTGTGMPLLPNITAIFGIVNEITNVAVVGLATGSTMYVTTGESS